MYSVYEGFFCFVVFIIRSQEHSKHTGPKEKCNFACLRYERGKVYTHIPCEERRRGAGRATKQRNREL
jgi:hypothetical protein